MLGAVGGLLVAAADEAGAADEAASLTMTAGRLVAGLASGLTDEMAAAVAGAAGLRFAASRHGCPTSATTATMATRHRACRDKAELAAA